MVQANCTWCEKPSSMRCGACHKTSFCSAECQKIPAKTWPIHKTVCGAETDVFRQAPLTQMEMLALDGIKDRLCGSGVPGEGEVFSKYMLSLCDGTSSLRSWQDIRAVLIAPITSVPLNIPDGIREMLISYGRAHLSICGHYPSEMCLERVWHFAASALLTCASELLTAKPRPMMTAALMVEHMAIATRVLNGYLRSTVWIALAVTLLTTQDSAPSDKRKWWFRLLLMHCKEQLDEVGAAEIDPAVRRSLQRHCEGRRAEYEALFVAGRFGVFT